MSSLLIISIYIPFFIATIVVTFLMLIRQNRNHMDNIFVVICYLIIGWFLVEIIKQLIYIPVIAKLMNSAFLLFVAFIPPNIMRLSIAFHKLDFRKHKKLFNFLIFLFPVITTILTVTGGFHNLIIEKLTVVDFWPVQQIDIVWGPWFWVHVATSYIMLIVTAFFVIIKYFDMPNIYRRPALLIVVSIALTCVTSLLKILNFFPYSFDPTIIGSCISLIIFFGGVVKNSHILFIGLSREAIFQVITDYIIIMDAEGYIADVNDAAKKMFAEQQIKYDSRKYDEVLNDLIDKGAHVKKPKMISGNEGVDVCITSKGRKKVLNIRMHKMKDQRGRFIGTVVLLYDVTYNRFLQDRLEFTAKVDVLTGLPNRTAYEGAQKRMNSPSALPLTLVMCDINGLKQANDIYGHEYGDRYIQFAASILAKYKPANGFLSRIGGDEFIYLLPQTDLKKGKNLIYNVQKELAESPDNTMNLSIAMGAAIKTSPDQDYNEVFNLADKKMYDNKRKTKETTKAFIIN